MARCSVVLAMLALLASPATPFRVKSKKSKKAGKMVENKVESTVGSVDMLYTYGAPGAFSPGFMNPNDPKGCLPGLRAWNGRRVLGFTGQADQVPMITVPLGYRHPMMDSAEFDVLGNIEVRKEACSQKAQDAPWYRLGDVILHIRTYYVAAAKTISPWFGNLTDMATVGSYFGDIEYISRRTEALGWKYVSMASHPGNSINGGPQQVHLVQDSRTLDCLMTFQGSDSPQDWVANLAVGKSHFCGFVDEDETCNSLLTTGVCKVKRAGSSFVHMGFRDHLRRMVRSDEFQNNIRPRLPGCAKFQVAGHSLGGAVSNLFAACSVKALKPGQYGYEEDYKYISFTKGAARRLWQ